MSEGSKKTYAEVMAAAQQIVTWLAPNCERIAIAGSLRRKKPMVSDIEIVAIPTLEINLFGEPTGKTLLDAALQQRGVKPTKNGPRYKQFSADGYTADLFLATPENWGYIFMLRTGSADFSRSMVTRAAWGGKMPNSLSVTDGNVYRSGTLVPVPTEEALFALWGMNFVPPELR